MIKEVTEAKAMISEGYSLKVKAGGLWYLDRDKSKPQRVHKNVIRFLRGEGRASFSQVKEPECVLFYVRPVRYMEHQPLIRHSA
jgi:hypothetical protein